MATMTTRQLADELQTSPEELRRFLRLYLPADEHAGKGRYHLQGRQLSRVKQAYKLWKGSSN